MKCNICLSTAVNSEVILSQEFELINAIKDYMNSMRDLLQYEYNNIAICKMNDLI